MGSSAEDYYAILQVHPEAEREVIDAAYRRLAAKYHPDVNPSPGAVKRMMQINAAYEVLSNPKKRAAYDAARGKRLSADDHVPGATSRGLQSPRLSRLLLPLGLLVLALASARLGPRAALMMVGLGVVVWLYLVLSKPGKGS